MLNPCTLTVLTALTLTVKHDQAKHQVHTTWLGKAGLQGNPEPNPGDKRGFSDPRRDGECRLLTNVLQRCAGLDRWSYYDGTMIRTERHIVW